MTEYRIAFAIIASLYAFSFLACSPSMSVAEDPKPLPNDDAGAPLSFDECGMTCWRIRSFGCREGKRVDCEETCAVLLDDGMPLPFRCIEGAKSVDAIRECRVRCLP